MIKLIHKKKTKAGRLSSAEDILNLFVSPQDALRNGLVTTEVLMWFYIGECIGKGGIIGYNVWILDCRACFSLERCMLNFLREFWEPINRCLLFKTSLFFLSFWVLFEQIWVNSKRKYEWLKPVVLKNAEYYIVFYRHDIFIQM